MRPWLVGLLLMALAMPAIAADEGQIEASCVSIAEAQRQDAKQAAALHLTVYELNGAEVASLNAFMGDRFNASVDIVTLFVFPNGASEYVIGFVEQDIKCGSVSFALGVDETALLLRVLRGAGI
jgi:hypothetical protein